MATARSVRVLLVEDHPLIRQELKTILQAFPNTLVVGEANTGDEAVVSVETLQPDIVLMDINLPALDGIAATRLIKTKYPHMTVIGLSADTSTYLVYAMTKAGAFDVLSKDKALNLHDVMQTALQSLSQPSPEC